MPPPIAPSLPNQKPKLLSLQHYNNNPPNFPISSEDSTMTTLNTKSYGASIIPNKFQQSVSPSRKFSSSGTISSSSSAFATSMSSLLSPTKSSSPNRTNESRWGASLVTINRGCVSASTPVRFPVDRRKASADRSVASPSSPREKNQSGNHVNSSKPLINGQKNCMCSPSTHPGSFRCSLHSNQSAGKSTISNRELYFQWYRLYLRKKAIKNSIVRTGKVEGDLEKRALASLIRPLPQKQRRRSDFQPKPSRLSVMSKAGD